MDACLNDEDEAIIQARGDVLDSKAYECAMDCVGSEAISYVDCSTPCLMGVSELSAGCAICFLAKSKCCAVWCKQACDTSLSSLDCISCLEQNGCISAHEECSGLSV